MDALGTLRTQVLDVLDADVFVAPGVVAADIREMIERTIGADITVDEAEDLKVEELVSTLGLNRERTPWAYWSFWCNGKHVAWGEACLRSTFWLAFSWSRCGRIIARREEQRGARYDWVVLARNDMQWIL